MKKQERTVHRIQYGRHAIEYEVEQGRRKTLEISVYPDLSVRVKAPVGKDSASIEKRVRRRASWIVKQREHFAQFLHTEPPRRYISGETHRYLGRQYRLKVLHSENTHVGMKPGYICVHVLDRTKTEKVKDVLNQWYRDKAKKKFTERLAVCQEAFRKHKIDSPLLHLKKMTKRWGSCSKKGKIFLNPELIKSPTHCIDYVIVHELCHLKCPSHSKPFYRLLMQVMPDWEQRKKRLEQTAK